MTIRTIGSDWGVFAEWYGETRLVFRGDIWQCLAFRRDNA